MNLTEASEVVDVIRAAYLDGTPEALEKARPAAVRLTGRIYHQLGQSGRPRIAPAQISKSSELVAVGAGPLLDPDCRDNKHTSCVGPPCECECHQPQPVGADAEPGDLHGPPDDDITSIAGYQLDDPALD